MNKRDLVLSLLHQSRHHVPAPIPAAFFMHFDAQYHRGQAAVDKHLQFFRYTGMDFVKIQYEHPYPFISAIEQAQDWDKMPAYDPEFFSEPVRVVEGLVKAAKADALVIVTLYSPLMNAVHATGEGLLMKHAHENPAAVKRGLEAVTESVRTFVKECIRVGVDGFYASTQGGESHRFDDVNAFNEFVRPYDLAIMSEINQACSFNILHICDYQGGYSDFNRFLDYPGQVVNCPLQVGGKAIKLQELADLFGRPLMGGLDRLGTLTMGSQNGVRQAAEAVLRSAPERFILAADCTVPSDTSWDNLKAAITTAHEFRR